MTVEFCNIPRSIDDKVEELEIDITQGAIFYDPTQMANKQLKTTLLIRPAEALIIGSETRGVFSYSEVYILNVREISL